MIPCIAHGSSAWCYVLLNGRHIDSEECCCYFSASSNCPIHGC